MGKETRKSHPDTFDDLITELESGDYKHLEIFHFHDKTSIDFVEDSKYLVINNNGFALYKLRNLDYREGKIQVEFINPETGNPAIVSLDIHETHPDLFIVNWKDIVDMVYDDQSVDKIAELGQEYEK